ncbi:hypothetical protein FA13DRAFT_1740403 [Coprinellus micaceus]|uniref:Uncharacterized protein n=1 Tax=Coprinellus micaceus TaxID=71717 RepID=A0A4Y7SMU1_COPMI|nr:hypothetical protein FA13DRAFT_1740403 [Coprinellus micaceus]
MQSKNVLLIAVAIFSPLLPGVFAAEGDVYTATKVFQTVVSQSPYLLEQTTVVTWTQSSSITESATPTVIPDIIQTGTDLAG